MAFHCYSRDGFSVYPMVGQCWDQCWASVDRPTGTRSPADTKPLANVVLMLGQRRRRWTNINPALAKCFVSAGSIFMGNQARIQRGRGGRRFQDISHHGRFAPPPPRRFAPIFKTFRPRRRDDLSQLETFRPPVRRFAPTEDVSPL